MAPDPGTLILRSDANSAIGTGHVMRCLALAQAWQDEGGTAVFAIAELPLPLRERLLSHGMEVADLGTVAGSTDDAGNLAQLAGERGASWVVVDGYYFGADYQRELKAAGLQVLFIDDNGGAGPYSADLVLNQNVHAQEALYSEREPYTRLLLGPRYVMLRREFRHWSEWKREIAPLARKVLVTMGGSDPDNITSRVIQALSLVQVHGLEATVVVGGGNPHCDSLQQQASRCRGRVRLLRDVSNMPELMAWADVAVSAAGTTCWEMCLLGLPAIVVDLAENQTPIARALQLGGIAVHVGDSSSVTPAAIACKLDDLAASEKNRATLSNAARKTVDSWGAGRVVSSMRGANLRLRRVQEKDCRLLWEWANDSVVRAASFSPEQIPWDTHVKWFHSKLAASDALLYLITDSEHVPIGAVRYQIGNARAVVSICLAPEFRGQGYGSMILELATREFFRGTDISMIDAYVKPGNEASQRLFHSAGFAPGATEEVSGQPAVHFALAKRVP